MKVFCAQINPTIGDLKGNTAKILHNLDIAKKQGADIVLFPELVLSGYPPEDLLLDPAFIDACEEALATLTPHTKGLFCALGTPRWNPTRREKFLFNSAAIFADGKLLGFKDKTLLPTYDVFDERRFFEPGSFEQPIWEYRGQKINVSICEDFWEHPHKGGYTSYMTDPVAFLQSKKPDLLLNLSASPYYFGRVQTRLEVFQSAAKTIQAPLVLCNQVGANDELVFDGKSFFLNEQGDLLQLAQGFVEDHLWIDLSAPKKANPSVHDPIADLYAALCLGVKDYFHKQGFAKAILGLSGGIDSAVACCIAVEALGSANVSAINMPTRYSSRGSVDDAVSLAKHLGIALKHIDIDPLFQQYLDLLTKPLGKRPEGLTEENLQSRIRGMVLMAFSNQLGSILLATGNKTEMAMGYTTLYGDMAGGLGPLQDVTKLRVYELAEYINREKVVIPPDILSKAPSAELRHGQKTTDDLHKFEILDPILEDYLEKRMSLEEISAKRGCSLSFVRELVGKIHAAEYKRRQAPIGIRVTEKAFSKGRNVPIVQKWR
jgi:NAD+ synthase (glutamine-hydrolysing)